MMPRPSRSRGSPAAGRRNRQLAALAALALGLAALALLTVRATIDAPRGALGIGLFALALATTWYGLVRRGALHILGFALGALLALVLTVLLILADPPIALGVMVAVGLALAAGSHAFRVRVPFPPAPRPTHPVVFWNPRSGGARRSAFASPSIRAQYSQLILVASSAPPGPGLIVGSDDNVRRAVERSVELLAFLEPLAPPGQCAAESSRVASSRRFAAQAVSL